MNEFLSTELISIAKCYVLNEDFLREKDGVDITVCCKDGRVLEVYNKSIVKSCPIQLKKPTIIEVFYAYNPTTKYYIIKEGVKVVVLKRTENNLEIFTEYHNVQKFEIDDFLKQGKPQVKIWLDDEMEPVITDFSKETDYSEETESTSVCYLKTRLNTMRLCLNEINDVALKKKNCYEIFLSKINNNLQKHCSVRADKCWQKLVDDYWIISVFVENVSDNSVKNLILLCEDTEVQIETKIISSMEPLKSDANLLPGMMVDLLGIIRLPNLVENSIQISKSFVLLYNVGSASENDFEEIKIPPFELNILKIFDGSYGLFNSTDYMNVIKIIRILNETTLLEIKFNTDNFLSEINDILTDKLNFITVNLNPTEIGYITSLKNNHNINKFFVNITETSKNSCKLKCFYASKKHLYYFINILRYFLTSISSISEINSNLKNESSILGTLNALDEEFKTFSNTMRLGIKVPKPLPLDSKEKLHIDANLWKNLLDSDISFNTDLKIHNVLKD